MPYSRSDNINRLRKAAASLRKTASEATPGPWEFSCYDSEHSSQKHHEMTLESVREQLLDIQHFLCAYKTTEGDGRQCDCKYLGVGHPSSEQTGCCELRQVIRSIGERLH
jgi:hypothetical protein